MSNENDKPSKNMSKKSEFLDRMKDKNLSGRMNKDSNYSYTDSYEKSVEVRGNVLLVNLTNSEINNAGNLISNLHKDFYEQHPDGLEDSDIVEA
ncbi:hypothetical protein SB6412_00408 [Klebsiella pasteurii]|uniref:hypothetical protein n=1 Tax=Klebsiella pasteurii TaxID=2587529 RepID=UPI00115B3D12|nr:hypothetical protein [Klebsiella pasteurii]VUS27996.1 hypothetical protein SB6412_00408 [Klebsiella pasteurii]